MSAAGTTATEKLAKVPFCTIDKFSVHGQIEVFVLSEIRGVQHQRNGFLGCWCENFQKPSGALKGVRRRKKRLVRALDKLELGFQFWGIVWGNDTADIIKGDEDKRDECCSLYAWERVGHDAAFIRKGRAYKSPHLISDSYGDKRSPY